MVDFEELHVLCKVSGALYQHDTPILLKVAEKLNVTGLEGMTRAKLIRRLRDQMEELEEGEEGVAVLRGLINEFECKEPQMSPAAPPPNEPSASPRKNEPPPSPVQAQLSQASSDLTVGFPPPPPPDLPQGLANIRAGWRHQSEGGLSFSS